MGHEEAILELEVYMRIEKENLTNQCIELQNQYHLPYEFGNLLHVSWIMRLLGSSVQWLVTPKLGYQQLSITTLGVATIATI